MCFYSVDYFGTDCCSDSPARDSVTVFGRMMRFLCSVCTMISDPTTRVSWTVKNKGMTGMTVDGKDWNKNWISVSLVGYSVMSRMVMKMMSSIQMTIWIDS